MKLLLSAFLLLTTFARADMLLVLNKADATLSMVDLGSMKSVATIPVGEGPHEIAVSGDGKIAVGVNYGTGPKPGSTLSVIDIASRKERRVALPGLLRPHGIQAIGSQFYFTVEGSRAVARYDATTDRIDWVGGTGQDVTHMLVLDAGGTRVYTTNMGSNSVSVLDLTNAPRQIGLRQIAVGEGPEGIDLAPDGSELWVASRVPNGGISIIDPKSFVVVRTIATSTTFANRLKFTPDGRHVLVSDATANNVLVFDAKTKELVKTIATAAGPSGIQVAGSRAFVACAGAKQVAVLDLETLSIVGTIETGNVPDGLAYVP